MNKKIWTSKVIKEMKSKLQVLGYCLLEDNKIKIIIQEDCIVAELFITKDGSITYVGKIPFTNKKKELPDKQKKILESILIKYGILKKGDE